MAAIAALREVLWLTLTHNLADLRVALENIEKPAPGDISRARLLPGVNARAQATRARTAADLNPPTLARSPPVRRSSAAGYELDLWGRVRNWTTAFAVLQNGRPAQRAHRWWPTWPQHGSRRRGRRAPWPATRWPAASRRWNWPLAHAPARRGLWSWCWRRPDHGGLHGDVASTTAPRSGTVQRAALLAGGTVPQHLYRTAQAWACKVGRDVAALTPMPVPLPSAVLLRQPRRATAESCAPLNANIGAAHAARTSSASRPRW